MTRAYAHAPAASDQLGFDWSFEPLVVIPMLLVGGVYLLGSIRLRQRSQSYVLRRDVLFWIGLGTMALALISPLHALATQVFTLHMIEHEILMVVSAPLLVASRPGAVLLWGLPRELRGLLAKATHTMKVVWAALTELWTATAIHALVLWVWHAPSLFRPVLQSEGFHILQHASFMFSALLFWAAVAASESFRRGEAVLALFIISLQAGFLGALLTVSRTLWYPFAPDPSPICGLTRGEDQSLAGLIMWIPACSIYALAALIVMAHWLSAMETRHA